MDTPTPKEEVRNFLKEKQNEGLSKREKEELEAIKRDLDEGVPKETAKTYIEDLMKHYDIYPVITVPKKFASQIEEKKTILFKINT